MPDRESAAPLEHWAGVYGSRNIKQVSWFQRHDEVSLRLVDQLDLPSDAAVVDVGAGAASLVDDLLARGSSDLTVLDISAAALALARSRVGGDLGVRWIEQDLLTWQPSRIYQLWHDRAVLHFLTTKQDRQRYVTALLSATAVGSGVVIGVFAADGPTSCSGLPVRRYMTEDLCELLGGTFAVVASLREEHLTPGGVVQPFTWLAARRTAD